MRHVVFNPWACEWSPGLVLVLIFQLTFFPTYHLGGNGRCFVFCTATCFQCLPALLDFMHGFCLHDGDGVPKCYPNMSVLTPLPP